jgi:hypothetical protein
VEWRQADFLSLTRSSCGWANVESSSSSPITTRAPSTNVTVICLGGPPYTTGAGSMSNTNMQRDLPQRFVSHCFDEYKAQFVAFFLPRRFEKHDWEYPCRTHELASSTFYFHGKKVRQPSILQCFTPNQT